MCGIAGIINLKNQQIDNIQQSLEAMNSIQSHRGPDGESTWVHKTKHVGFAHRRLSIIDLVSGDQPMSDQYRNTIVFNGEIYNYIELKKELDGFYKFRTSSDTEVILAAYQKWGNECVSHFRGMFSFAIWDESRHEIFCARDRFGIKPYYYTLANGNFIFASEAKTLLPFQKEIKTNLKVLKEYLVFQLLLTDQTMFDGIKMLLPGHYLILKNSKILINKYWETQYKIDFTHTEKYFQNQLREILEDSIKIHLRSDVPVGSYISGGIDSSLVSILARKYQNNKSFKGFVGKFSINKKYDESSYARQVAAENRMKLYEIDITAQDFIKNIRKVIYHLDYPVAGPGSFPQFMVSQAASKHLKVVLGGQGGDEIFGGYARYLIAYFEQCIKGAVEGTMNKGNYIVTYESIIPNLEVLKDYIPTIKEFWSEGLFEERDRRYFRLINRGNNLKREINWDLLEPYSSFKAFQNIYWGNNVEKESYFDSMTNFDFKTLLPALLQVEDRMSMAFGLESRVPLLDHRIVELAATVPSSIKFKNGTLKNLLKTTFDDVIPRKILDRKDKMGFPTPLSDWMRKDIKEFVSDIFNSQTAKQREYLNTSFDINSEINEEGKFGRKLWGLLSLELWQEEFHDKQSKYKNLLK
jgi:asparagine synthase (glutamine-hydrolysing)